MKTNVELHDLFKVECYGPDGRLKWVDYIDNLVVDAGINDALDKYFKGSNYTATHYIGITSGSPTFAASDTMASHSGWSEITAYSQTTRPQATWGSVSAKQISNSGSPAQFSITSNVTIGGAFIATDSTKGGTSGTLYGGGAFAGGNKTLGNGDTLSVTVTASGSSS